MSSKPNQIVLEVIYNIAFSLIGAVTLVWAIRYASIIFGSLALGVFLFSRRVGSTAANFLQLGLSKSLTRYVSIDLSNNSKKKQYLLVSILIWFIVGFLVFCLLAFFAADLAELVYPDIDNNSAVLLWTIIFSWSLVLNYFIRSSFIADRKIVLANIFEAINASGFLVLALIIFGKTEDILPVISFHSVSVIIFSLLVLMIYQYSLGKISSISIKDILAEGKKLLVFGFPRAIISTLDMLILLIGPWLIRDRVDQSGFLIISLSALRIIQTMIKPVMEITSTTAARHIGSNKQNKLDAGVNVYFQLVLIFSIMSTAFLLIWSDFLIGIWLEDPVVISGVRSGLSILTWAIVPFTLFHSLKGIVEMNWTAPYNLISLAIGVLVQIGAFYLLRVFIIEEVAINTAILLSYFFLAIMTVVWLKPQINTKIVIDILVLLLISAFLVITNAFFANDPNLVKLMISFGIYSLFFISYFYFYPSNISGIIKKSVRRGEINYQ